MDQPSPSGATGEQGTHKKIMADTYTQLYIHIIFAVKNSQSLIPKQHKAALHQYITRIITHKKQRVIEINSMPDHLHLLVGITPDIAVSDLVRDVKSNSSRWINRQAWVIDRFAWQTGFAAFSYAHAQLDAAVRYINNQEVRHSRQTFKEEYLEFLRRFEVPYNPKYVFDTEEVSKA